MYIYIVIYLFICGSAKYFWLTFSVEQDPLRPLTMLNTNPSRSIIQQIRSPWM